MVAKALGPKMTGQGGQPETLQPTYQYVWSARYIDSPVLRDENTDTDGLCDDGRIYYLTDANFNVTTLVDTGGDAIERYLYDPYGKVTMYDGGWSSTRSYSSYGNYILYTGRELDPNTGLYYYRNRYYHPGLGRFISRDPIGYEARDENLYRYVANRPLMKVDGDGLGIVLPRLEGIGPRGEIRFMKAECDIYGFNAGKVGFKYFPLWHALGPCAKAMVYVHESVHVAQMSSCCREASKSFKQEMEPLRQAGKFDEFAFLLSKYDHEYGEWLKKNEDIMECQAHTASFAVSAAAVLEGAPVLGYPMECQADTANFASSAAAVLEAAAILGYSGLLDGHLRPWGKCCSDLRRVMKNSLKMMGNHCPKAMGQTWEKCPWPKPKGQPK